jgi:hypothetical protein
VHEALTAALPGSTRRKNSYLDLIAAVAIGLCILYVMPHLVMVTGRNDFTNLYLGGLLYGTPEYYSPTTNQQQQVELTGAIQVNCYFQRPPFYGLLLKPLSWLPYYRAYLVYQALSLLCVIYFVWSFALEHKDLLPLAIMSPPLIANFILGQDVTLVLALLTATILLTRRRADFAAGMILSICAIKFHLLTLVPVAVLLHRRFRIFSGAVTGGLILFLVGLGGGGFAVYPRLLALLRNPLNHPAPEIMPNLRGFVYAFTGENLGLVLVLSAFVAAVTSFLARKAESFEAAFGYCLLGGLLVSFHAYMQDCLVLLFAFVLLPAGPEFKLVRKIWAIMLSPVPYVMLYLGPPFSPVFHVLPLMTLAAAIYCYIRRMDVSVVDGRVVSGVE